MKNTQKVIRKEVDEISIVEESREYDSCIVKHTDGTIKNVFNGSLNDFDKQNDFEYIEMIRKGIRNNTDEFEIEDGLYVYSDEDLKFIADFLLRNEYILDSRDYYVVQEYDGNPAYFWDKIEKQCYTLDNPSIWYDDNEDFIVENKLCSDDILIKYMEDQVVFTDVSKLEYEKFLSDDITIMFEMARVDI